MQTSSVSSPNASPALAQRYGAVGGTGASQAQERTESPDRASISPQAKALQEAEQRGPLTAPAQPAEDGANTRQEADRDQARTAERLAPQRQAVEQSQGSRQAQARIDTIV